MPPPKKKSDKKKGEKKKPVIPKALKTTVRLDGVPLAGTEPVTWRFVTGPTPYLAVFSVHMSAWKNGLEKKIGQFINLEIADSRGSKVTIRDLTILHRVSSSSPHRVSFVVADRRWKWAYKIIARDYNVPRKTGDRTVTQSVPRETQVEVDEYDYLPYSLKKGERWTAKEAVKDVLELLEKEEEDEDKTKKKKGDKGKGKGGTPKKSAGDETKITIESFPIREKGSDDGQFSLHNVILRDQGDAALSRLLSYIPGAEVYVDGDGYVRVFDGTDLQALDQYYRGLPPITWDGDAAAYIDRTKIRPAKVVVYYQRELEVLFKYSDDYTSNTSADPTRDFPYLDNVILTVDDTTDVEEYDPQQGKVVARSVPPGTWVEFRAWLRAMDKRRPDSSFPWTFETIRRHWIVGDLDGALGAGGLDNDPHANVSMRVQAIKQHFRQTFRVNRRYMERIRDIQAIRIAILDPVTGARAPAAVWGQACVIPTKKGARMAGRTEESAGWVYRNINSLPEFFEHTLSRPPSPARVSMLDRDLGVFHVGWAESPYGTVSSYVPCHVVGEGPGEYQDVPTRDLEKQDTYVMGPGMRIEGGTNGCMLAGKMELRVMMTVVPAAPNNKKQFHRVEVKAEDIKKLFRTEYRIQEGKGPDLEIFISPGEITARLGWEDDLFAQDTISRLLGMKSDDPDKAGLGKDAWLRGYYEVNQGREIKGHSRSVAAEVLASFADNIQGTVSTRMPHAGIFLRGNMDSATIQVSPAPSAKASATHEFPGQQRPISRFALMPESVRQLVLGTLPYGRGDT